MSWYKGALILLQVAIAYNFVLPIALYMLFFLNRARNRNGGLVEEEMPDFGIIVTAYEEVQNLPAVVDSLLQLTYNKFLVYVVADNCNTEGLHFGDHRVILLRPEKPLASNIGSHFFAIKNFKRAHSHITIIDNDNLVHPEYLNEMVCWFREGFDAVQGVRLPKNLNTTYACLDAARDIYYHFYDGKILFGLGSSATLSGSGMAFTLPLYRCCLEGLLIKGPGFDKVLQYEIVKRKKRIAFATNAVVYDEKTSKNSQLINQRSRWISTWFRYFKFGFQLISQGIFTVNWNQFLFGIVLLRPPLFIFLILGLLCALLDFVFIPAVTMLWVCAFLIFGLAFLISLRASNTDRKIYRALKSIPLFIYSQVIALLRIGKVTKGSVATTHLSHIQYEELYADRSK